MGGGGSVSDGSSAGSVQNVCCCVVREVGMLTLDDVGVVSRSDIGLIVLSRAIFAAFGAVGYQSQMMMSP